MRYTLYQSRYLPVLFSPRLHHFLRTIPALTIAIGYRNWVYNPTSSTLLTHSIPLILTLRTHVSIFPQTFIRSSIVHSSTFNISFFPFVADHSNVVHMCTIIQFITLVNFSHSLHSTHLIQAQHYLPLLTALTNVQFLHSFPSVCYQSELDRSSSIQVPPWPRKMPIRNEQKWTTARISM